MAKDLAVVLNNGSINSAVVTAIANQKHRPVMVFADVTGNAGSRARGAYEQQVSHFKPYREHVLPMQRVSAIRGQSASGAQAADPRQAGLLQTSRLLDLLPLMGEGIRLAAHYQAAAVYVGLRVGGGADDLGQATEYLQILNELIQIPCQKADLEIHAPLLELDPWQVIDVGHQVAAPMDRTWSCQEDTTDPCWTCAGCRARDAAFQQAAKPDPLRLAKKA